MTQKDNKHNYIDVYTIGSDDELYFQKSVTDALSESDYCGVNDELTKQYSEFIKAANTIKGFWGNQIDDDESFLKQIESSDDEYMFLYANNSYNYDSWLDTCVDYLAWHDSKGDHMIVKLHLGGDVRGNYSTGIVYDIDSDIDPIAEISSDLYLSCACGSIASMDGCRLDDIEFDGPLNKNGMPTVWKYTEGKFTSDNKLVCNKCQETVCGNQD